MAYEILNFSCANPRTTSIQRAVIVAMIAVPVVQSAAGNVIDMVAVRRHFVATTVVAAVTGRRRAIRRIHGGDFDDVFVVMIAVRRMHVSVVQIISVTAVRHGRMTAIRAVNVGMIFMGCMIHGIFLTFVFNDDWPGATDL